MPEQLEVKFRVVREQMTEGRLSLLGGKIGSRRTTVGRKCLLIICVGVSAARRMTMREGEANRKMRLACPSDGNRTRGEAGKEEAAMKVTGCLRA